MDKKDIADQVIQFFYSNKSILKTKRLPDIPRHEVISAIKRIEPNITTKNYTKVLGELRGAHKTKLTISADHIPYSNIIDDILKDHSNNEKDSVKISSEILKSYIKRHTMNLDLPQLNKVIAHFRKHYSSIIDIPHTIHLFDYDKFLKKFLKKHNTPITIDRDVIKREVCKFDNKLVTNDAISAIIQRIEEKHSDVITITKQAFLYQTLLENIYKHEKKDLKKDAPIEVSRDIAQELAKKQYPDADSQKIKNIIHSLRNSYPIIIPTIKAESFETKLVKTIYKDKGKNIEESSPIQMSVSHIKKLIAKELPGATKEKINTITSNLRKKHSHHIVLPPEERMSHLEIAKNICRHLDKDTDSSKPPRISQDIAIKTIGTLYPKLTSKQVREKINSLKSKYSDVILIEKPIVTCDYTKIVDKLCGDHKNQSMPLELDKEEVVSAIKKCFSLYEDSTIFSVYGYLLNHYSSKITVPYKTFPYADLISQLFLKYPKYVDKNSLLVVSRTLVEKEIVSTVNEIGDDGIRKIIDNLRANYPHEILIPVKPNANTLQKYARGTDIVHALFRGKSHRIIRMSSIEPYVQKPIRFKQERIFFYQNNTVPKQYFALIDDSPLKIIDTGNEYLTPLLSLETETLRPYRNTPIYLYGLSILFNKTHNLTRPQRLSKKDYNTQLSTAAKELKRLGYIATYPSQIQSLFRILLLTDIALPIDTQHTDTIKKHLNIFKNVGEYRDHMFTQLKAKLGAIKGETVVIEKNKFYEATVKTIDPAKLLNNTSNLKGIQHRLTYDKQSIKIEDIVEKTSDSKKTKNEIPNVDKELILVKKRKQLPLFNTTKFILSTIKKTEVPLLWIEFKELISALGMVANKQRNLDREMLATGGEYKKLDLQTIVNISTIKKTDLGPYEAKTAYLISHAKIFLAWLSVSKNLCLLSVNFWNIVHHRQDNIGPKIAQVMQGKQSEQIKHLLEKDKKGEKSYINYLLGCTNLSDPSVLTEESFGEFKAYGLKNLESIPGLSTNSTKEIRWKSFHEMLYAMGGHNLFPPLPEKNTPEFYTEKYLREFKSTQSIRRFYNSAISMYNNSDVGEDYIRDMARIFDHMVKFPIQDVNNFTDDDFNKYTDPSPQNTKGFHSFLFALESNHTAPRLQAKLLMTAQAVFLDDGLKFKESYLIQKYATPKGKTKQAIDEEILIKMKEICLLNPPPSTHYPIKKINSKNSWWTHEHVEPFLPMSIFIAASFPHRSAHTINHDIDTFIQYDSLGNFNGLGIFTDKNKDRKKPFFIPKNIVYQMFGSFYLNTENQDTVVHEKAEADIKLLEYFVNYAKNDYLNSAEIQLAFVSNNKRNLDGKFKPLFYHPKNNGHVLGKLVFDDYFYRVLVQALHELDIDINNFVTLGTIKKSKTNGHKITGKNDDTHHISEIPNKGDDAYEDFIWHTTNKSNTKSQLISPQGFSPHALRMSNITRLIDFNVDPVIILMLSGLEHVDTMIAHYIDRKIYTNYRFTRKVAKEMGYEGDLTGKLIPDAIRKFFLSQDNSTKETLENLFSEGFTSATIIDYDGGYRYNDDPESFLLQYDQKFWNVNSLGICTRPDCILNGECGVCPFFLTGHVYIKNLNVMLMSSTTSLAINGRKFYDLRTSGELNDIEAKLAEDMQREKYLIHMGWDSIIEKLAQTSRNHMQNLSLSENQHKEDVLSGNIPDAHKSVETGKTIKVELFTGMLSFYLEARDSGTKTICKDYELITSRLANKINRFYNKYNLWDIILETAPMSAEDQIELFTKLTNLTSSDAIFQRITKSKSNEKNIFMTLSESLEGLKLTEIKKMLSGS